MRFEGTLVQWNDDRGFGFIAPEPAGQKLFVHVSAFPRDGRRPQLGESLSFEVQAGSDGRKQAIAVQRPASTGWDRAPRQQRASPNHRPDRSALASGAGGRSFRAVALVVVLCAAAGAYWWTARPQATADAGAAPAAAAIAPPMPLRAQTTVSFRCDGRKYCSEMTSCAEATFFLKNCPDPRMDGNHDGIPCEQQWCTGPGAR